jgi:rubrerythrin
MAWNQLAAILEQARRDAEAEATKELTECPDCGFSPLHINSAGQHGCPICSKIIK